MTVADFVHEAQGYYGAYSPTIAKYVTKWFEKHAFSERDIAELWAETLKALSSSFKTPPDVAALESALKAMRSRDDHRPERQRYLPPPPDTQDYRAELADMLSKMARKMIVGGKNET